MSANNKKEDAPNKKEDAPKSSFTRDMLGKVLLIGVLFSIIFVISASKLFATRKAANEAEVIAFCYEFYRAQMKYLQINGRFSPNMVLLAESGLLSVPIQRLDKMGYYFYIHNDESKCSTPDGFCWELQAAPIDSGIFGTGSRYFYIDSKASLVYFSLATKCAALPQLPRPDYSIGLITTESPIDKCVCADPDKCSGTDIGIP